MEHRWGRRIEVDIPIHVTLASAPLMKRAQLSNLSMTGGLIKADFKFRVLSRVHVVFGPLLNDLSATPNLTGYVARDYRHGIAVEWFGWSSPAVTDFLRGWVSAAQADDLRSRVKRSDVELRDLVARERDDGKFDETNMHC